MKKILVSAAVAAMALSTTASALEDIKVNGQAKLWYETNNKENGPAKDNSLFDKDSSEGEVVFKLGMTGKQGDVGFGATMYHSSTMGLENRVVSGVRTGAGYNDLLGAYEYFDANGNPTGDRFNDRTNTYLGELYFTAPVAPNTVLKFGKQELDTPLAFTERWNAAPNTFDAAVAINSSVENLTLIGAYIGKGNAVGFKAQTHFDSYFGSAYAIAGLYANDGVSANFWAYKIHDVLDNNDVYAAWFDAGMKAGDVNAKAYLAYLTHDGDKKAKKKDTIAVAASADITVSDIKIFGAASHVTKDGLLAVANTATGFKKTKLPTAGIYTDGLYVAQPGSTAFKLSAATKLADTGLSLNVVNNTNSDKAKKALETTEVYATVSQKLGAFDLTGIIMHRDMNDSATDKSVGGQYVRLIASVNF